MSVAKRGETEPESTASFVLFADQTAYDEFQLRHGKNRVKRGNLSSYTGKIYLGIDAGSTTTKIIAMGEDKQVLYSSYGSNQGSPLDTVIHELREFYVGMNKTAQIAGTGTTGYGEAIIKAAIHADFGEVETFAHLRAAQEFCPTVSLSSILAGRI